MPGNKNKIRSSIKRHPMKPYGRQTRKKVGTILMDNTRTSALKRLESIPDEQLTNHLFSHLYHMDELIKFRSATAMGELALRLAAGNMEKARIVLRRIMWNLNDESGGIGWGSPEAMGEILAKSPELANEFGSILLSYLNPGGTYIEHEILQQGVIWGIGTYLEAAPLAVEPVTEAQLRRHLESRDPVKRGYAMRALINAGRFRCHDLPGMVRTDPTGIRIFTGWHFANTRISDMAHACDIRKPAGA